ncbi:hypothetical protein HDU96_006654 [Phlyctochytrium bullatum]|nr:hypothetical protein HDU96_006654 [Phlyctochytrium bullatum]
MGEKKMRLRFKGEPKKKGKKRKADDKDEDDSGDIKVDGWDTAEVVDDLSGPVMILSNVTDPPSVLTCDELNPDKLSFKPLKTDDPDAPAPTISTVEPTSVHQVFVINRLPTSGTKFSFKSAFDKYLTSDKFGIVSASVEAVGPAEEWEVIFRDDGIAFQNARDMYLCAESGVARADSGAVGFREVFRIRVQAQCKAKYKKKKKEVEVDAETLEFEYLYAQVFPTKKFQSWGNGRRVMAKEDSKKLKKAVKEGSLNEALLDRREKIKSDKFCK